MLHCTWSISPCCCRLPASASAATVNPTLLEFTTFKEQVLAPFILSAEQHEQVRRSSISHDTAHPGPEEIDSMELNLSGGVSGAGHKPVPAQQQQQQQSQSKI